MEPSQDQNILLTLPLLPIPASSINLIDIILPPLLIGLALVIFDIQAAKTLSPKTQKNSHLFVNKTVHARFLPSPSNHRFKYDIVQFGVDLDHLESHLLDIPHLFRFHNGTHDHHHQTSCQILVPSTWINLIQIFSISPSSYFKTKTESIKQALFDQLETQFMIEDVDSKIGKVYLLSMPTYLGYTTINPLSIYFCYQKSDTLKNPPLKYVVLDVQNTFDERHSYLLTIGVNETPLPNSSEFDHQWVIPRAFHVSPFNDRTGTYQISLSDPFATQSGNNNTINLNFKIVFFTSKGEKKFFADLKGEGIPFTSQNLIKIWIKYPLILFMTSLKIIYQSFKLHMCAPRLNVYPKPDPIFDEEYSSKGYNPVQKDGGVGGTAWQDLDWRSRLSRKIVVDYLTERVNQIAVQKKPYSRSKSSLEIDSFVNQRDDSNEKVDDGLSEEEEEEESKEVKLITVILKPTDPSQEPIIISPTIDDTQTGGDKENLTIWYSSNSFYTDLLLYPNPSISQLINDRSEHNWKVSSVDLYDRVFESPYGPQDRTIPIRLGRIDKLLRKFMNKIRSFYFNWLLSFLTSADKNLPQLSKRSSYFPPPHFIPIHERFQADSNPLDPTLHIRSSLMVLSVLVSLVSEQLVAYFLFRFVFRFRFVHGYQPWFVLRRSVLKFNHVPLDKGDAGLGSVREPSSSSST
ncbi:hypothetical protein KEM48_000751 [Puccinia striiformis f. sp. tritici PST-130]|nr:hypothetical protein KEM48_000751 [Puccinia striiformis f. sp. tritici PST-130]